MKNWRFWIGIIISVFFLYISLRGLALADFWQALQNANYWWLIPGVAVYFIGVWVRAWRWHYMLRPLKKIPTQTMFPIVAIGYMGNNIYPARAGEVLRAAMLKQREGVPISASLATVVVERIFDGVVMLAFVFLNLPELARLTGVSLKVAGMNISIPQLALIGTVIFAGALGVFMLAAMFPRFSEKIVDWLVLHIVPVRYKTQTRDISIRFLSGLESLRSPFEALMILFTTVIIWLLETGKYWFVMHAFPFQVSFFTLMLMNGIVNLATTIPSAPGYVGTFDAPGIAVLVAYRVNQAIAASYTIVLHVALWFPITLLGAYFYWRQPLRWGADMQSLREEEAGLVMANQSLLAENSRPVVANDSEQLIKK
ncbi:MAG: flippase-like domain-containing protein [Anaerolineaceae bacterium]|nr:flippase-like domain-containing protein [Anaerolineaceae bacterium]